MAEMLLSHVPIDAALRDLVREVVTEVVEAALQKTMLAAKPAASTATSPSEYLTVAAAAKMAAVSPETIRKWVSLGHLPLCRAGRLLRVRAVDLDAYLMRAPLANEKTPEQMADELLARVAAEDVTRCAACHHLAKLHHGGRCGARRCGCRSYRP